MLKRKNAKFDAICILGTMRTGSNLLERIMTQNPEIIGAGELFNPNFIFRRAKSEYHGITIPDRDANPDGLLQKAIEVNAPRLPLFRFFPDHSPAALESILNDPRIAKILLKRNPIDSFISVEIARRNTQWILTRREKDVAEVRFTFREAEFQNWLSTSDQFYEGIEARLRAMGQEFYEIAYENIKNYGMLDELAEFLALQAGWPQFIEPLERQNPRARESYLKNPESLETLQAPDWQPRQIDNRLPEPIIAQSYFAPKLGLVFVPIFGNSDQNELEVLRQRNEAEPVLIHTKDVAKLLQNNPELRAYTRVIHPMDRIYLIFMRHLFQETNGFDVDFLAFANETMGQALKGYPEEKSMPSLAKIGLKNDRQVKKFLRNFIIETRKELWSGFRNHLLSDQYWPNALIVDNLRQSFELTTIVGDGFPDEPAFESMKQARVNDPMLFSPIDAPSSLREAANVQIYDLYKEDYVTYGFPIKLD